MRALILAGVSVLLLTIAALLYWRGHHRRGAALLIFGIIFGCSTLSGLFGGLQDTALTSLFVAVGFAGLLIGARGAILTSFIAALAGVGVFAFSSLSGRSSVPAGGPGFQVLLLAIVLLLCGWIFGATIVRLKLALERANEEIERRAQLERALAESRRMESVGRLAGGVAHDFNNLLTIIIMQAESLAESESPEEQAECVEDVLSAAKRASGLTKQLLAYSRKQVLKPQPLDLNALLKELKPLLLRLVGESVDLSLACDESLGRICADPTQIEQVVVNLSANARDAMPNGGKLTLETTNVELSESYALRYPTAKPGRYVLLSVSDTGEGMDGETIDRIFEPFFSTKGPDRGTGLGLATVHGIVLQSGGHITVYSEPGQSTVFKVYLPRVEAPVPARVERGESAPSGLRAHILVVEDDEGVRKATLRALKKAGHHVTVAQGGEEAIELAKGLSQLDLIISDVVLKGASGTAIVQELSKMFPKAKILYISGYTENAIVHHGVLDEGVNFLAKPYTSQALIERVNRLLEPQES